jgi:triacylglycerol esterase/lipase EstA (alpha/beta hydrolase family)
LASKGEGFLREGSKREPGLGFGKRIASMTTLNSPHRGLFINKKIIDHSIVKKTAEVVAKFIGHDFSPYYMEEQFQLDYPDDESIMHRYSWGGFAAPEDVIDMMTPGFITITISGQGANDGLIPIPSMKWGTYLGTVNTSHTGIINQGFAPTLCSDKVDQVFNAIYFYKREMERLCKIDYGM